MERPQDLAQPLGNDRPTEIGCGITGNRDRGKGQARGQVDFEHTFGPLAFHRSSNHRRLVVVDPVPVERRPDDFQVLVDRTAEQLSEFVGRVLPDQNRVGEHPIDDVVVDVGSHPVFRRIRSGTHRSMVRGDSDVRASGCPKRFDSEAMPEQLVMCGLESLEPQGQSGGVNSEACP